jgi:hypothetical protein
MSASRRLMRSCRGCVRRGDILRCALSLIGAFDRESEDEGLAGSMGACEVLIGVVRKEKGKGAMGDARLVEFERICGIIGRVCV